MVSKVIHVGLSVGFTLLVLYGVSRTSYAATFGLNPGK